jgi:hypothetical protein
MRSCPTAVKWGRSFCGAASLHEPRRIIGHDGEVGRWVDGVSLRLRPRAGRGGGVSQRGGGRGPHLDGEPRSTPSVDHRHTFYGRPTFRRVHVDRLELAYQCVGEGPPLVLIPGTDASTTSRRQLDADESSVTAWDGPRKGRPPRDASPRHPGRPFLRSRTGPTRSSGNQRPLSLVPAAPTARSKCRSAALARAWRRWRRYAPPGARSLSIVGNGRQVAEARCRGVTYVRSVGACCVGPCRSRSLLHRGAGC